MSSILQDSEINHSSIINEIYQDSWIEYPVAAKAIALMDELLHYPRVVRMPSLLIHGQSGMGKTMIASEFCRRNPMTFKSGEEASYHHVLYIEVPPDPDERSFYEALLSAFDAPIPYLSKIHEIRDVVLNLISKIQCKILLIDEIHNLLSGSGRQQRVFLNTLRHLSNRLNLPLVCFGIDSALRAIAQDDQLANRFEVITLPKWKMNDDFANLVFSILQGFPLDIEENLIDEEFLKTILNRTDGVLKRIKLLLQRAAVYCIREGHPSFTAEALNNVDNYPPLISMALRSNIIAAKS